MNPSHARAKTPTKAPKTSASPSRKRNDAVRDIAPTGVRIPPDVLARLDVIVGQRNDALAAQGASTSRAALIVAAVREFCDREEKRALGAST